MHSLLAPFLALIPCNGERRTQWPKFLLESAGGLCWAAWLETMAVYREVALLVPLTFVAILWIVNMLSGTLAATLRGADGGGVTGIRAFKWSRSREGMTNLVVYACVLGVSYILRRWAPYGSIPAGVIEAYVIFHLCGSCLSNLGRIFGNRAMQNLGGMLENRGDQLLEKRKS